MGLFGKLLFWQKEQRVEDRQITESGSPEPGPHSEPKKAEAELAQIPRSTPQLPESYEDFLRLSDPRQRYLIFKNTQGIPQETTKMIVEQIKELGMLKKTIQKEAKTGHIEKAIAEATGRRIDEIKAQSIDLILMNLLKNLVLQQKKVSVTQFLEAAKESGICGKTAFYSHIKMLEQNGKLIRQREVNNTYIYLSGMLKKERYKPVSQLF